jgi:transposase
MNRNEATGREHQTGEHSLAIRGALGSYALAMGTETGLEQARDAIIRLLGEARAETHEAWRMLDAALAAEASPSVEAQE